MKHHFKQLKQTEGVALLLSIILMSVILVLVTYMLSFSLTERRISTSQSQGTMAYYLAEAGVNEMISKLKNDAGYKTSFETNPSWNTSFTRNNPLSVSNSLYTVTIQNTSNAHGSITATAKITSTDGNVVQRVVKTYIYKAIGQSGIGNNAGYSDGNIEITNSTVNYTGGIHSNNVFNIKNGSTVNVQGDLAAVGNYLTSGAISTVNVTGTTYGANLPAGPAPEIVMPAIDFNSSDPNSYKNLATSTYTAAQFRDLMNATTTLVLKQGITYVSGNTDIDHINNLTIPGTLVVEGDLTIGVYHDVNVTINHTSGFPAGILVTNKITIGEKIKNLNAQAVIYANNAITVQNVEDSYAFSVTGGLVAGKLTITGCSRPIDLINDNNILIDVLKATEYSPVVLVDHWEEEY